jgi:6,7-dimethyl-8-ribityllumazine synthase
MTIYEGKLLASDMKIGVVVARFNELITEKLLEGAVWSFRRHGGNEDNLTVARVPGAFELPIAAQTMAETGNYGAIVCLGCVIRGSTSHYDYVCSAATSGISQVALKTGIPVIFGVLTTDTLEQAFDRAGAKAGNKGAEAMDSALEMSDLIRHINS